MVAALTLLVAQTQAQPPEPTFAQVLDVANKAWYELPAATTTLRMEVEGGLEFSEARNGPRFVRQVSNGKNLVAQFLCDGSRTVTILPTSRQYAVEVATERVAWIDRELAPVPELAPDQFNWSLDPQRGLSLVVAGHVFTVLGGAPAKPGAATRLIKAEIRRPATSDRPAGLISFSGTLDGKLGYFRRATISVSNPDKPGETTKILWQCWPRIADGTEFGYDLAKLTGWTKIDPPETR